MAICLLCFQTLRVRCALAPSAHALVRRCHLTWRKARATLIRAYARYKTADQHHSPAPAYRVGQKVWLSTQDLPLRVESHKLTPRFVGPFPICKVISSMAVWVSLPCNMRAHPTFHVSKLKPTKSSLLGTLSHFSVCNFGFLDFGLTFALFVLWVWITHLDNFACILWHTLEEEERRSKERNWLCLLLRHLCYWVWAVSTLLQTD